MPLNSLTNDLSSGSHVKSRKQAGVAVPLIVLSHSPSRSQFHRQEPLRPTKRMYQCLLVHRQYTAWSGGLTRRLTTSCTLISNLGSRETLKVLPDIMTARYLILLLPEITNHSKTDKKKSNTQKRVYEKLKNSSNS